MTISYVVVNEFDAYVSMVADLHSEVAVFLKAALVWLQNAIRSNKTTSFVECLHLYV